jgi:hypothetical protein
VTDGDLPFFPAQAKAPPHPVSKAMRIGCAGLVFLFGVALFIGNKTGLFPTIPYAGYLVMGFGALLIGAAAADKSRSETQLERAFRLNIRSKLRDYREWSKARKLTGCRLVRYSGPDLVETRDILLAQVERQLESFQWRGFQVDWAEHEGRLYLRAWEVGGPEPDWAEVVSSK